MERFLLTFIPLFVAMDAIGNLPFLLALTANASPQERSRVVRQAAITGFVIGILFLSVGQLVLHFLGVTVADFLVAGGTVLLVIAMVDLVTTKVREGEASLTEMVGVVPLGFPLVVGPAVLTTLLLLYEQHGWVEVVSAFVLNLAITWVVFTQANRISAFLGQGGVKAISKITLLLLAAIAVKMIRQGILEILAGG